jgi:adenylyltransferase/sulfurtransferase
MNPLIEVIAIPEKVTRKRCYYFKDYDVIVDGSDNATRYLVNDTCVSLGKTLIYRKYFGF